MRRRPDRVATVVLAGVVVLGVLSVAVYAVRREWLGPWLGGHLTNTVFVLVVVVSACVTGLVVCARRRVGYLLGGLALLAALGLEVRQGFVPGQAFDSADAWLSVVATALAFTLVGWLDLRHLREPETVRP